jgi:hypothetical protein
MSTSSSTRSTGFSSSEAMASSPLAALVTA